MNEIYKIRQVAFYHVRRANLYTDSLDRKVHNNDVEKDTKLIDMITDDFNFYQNLSNKIFLDSCTEKANLTNREQFILDKVKEGYNQREIGRMLNYSNRLIQQNYSAIVSKIKQSVDNDLHLKIGNNVNKNIKFYHKKLKKYYLYDDGREEILLFDTFDNIHMNIFPEIASKVLRSYIYKKVKIKNRYYIFKSKDDLDNHIKGKE